MKKNKEKGSRKALEMIRNSSTDICWYIFGTILDIDLLGLQKEKVIKYGTYSQKDIPKLIASNHIDVVCILPTWPETFCYTLSEAVRCNVPVFVTDIGATGERVRRHGYGWTVPVDDSGEQMYEKLVSVLEDEAEFIKINVEAMKPFLEVAEKNGVVILSENLLWGASIYPENISNFSVQNKNFSL